MLGDIWLVFVRSVRPTLRNPVMIAVGLSQPLLYLGLFGPLLGAGAWQWFVPGLLVQMTLFGTAYAGFSLMPEMHGGVLERLRVTPVSRFALLVGRVLKDVVLLVVQAVLIVLAALLFGFETSVGAVLLGIGLVALLGVAVGSVACATALRAKYEYVLASIISTVAVQLLLLSGVLLPMTNGPRWLYWLSRVNPLSHVVDAERAIFGSGSLGWGLAATAFLVVAGLTFGARTFNREQA